MASTVDTAKDLMAFAAGPSLVGTAAVLGYARRVLGRPERKAATGWLALGSGAAVFAWMVVFIAWAAPTVLRSWRADGEADVTLVMLSATWFAAIGLVGALVVRAPSAARYLGESYRDGEGPAFVRMLRRLGL